MINKVEIDQKSAELEVHTSDVQRDYVFGWLLSGIYNASEDLSSRLILKGGNAFRKGYFENARYSNDLDFSVQTEIDPLVIQREINRVCEYVGDQTGIKFILDQNNVQLKKSADSEDKVYEARVYFKGFYGEENFNIRVKLDMKEFDRIYLPIQTRNIIHSYSDSAECSGQVQCHKLEELLASKLLALLGRHHSPDLFDFVYSVFFQSTLQLNRREIVTTFLKKSIYEPNPIHAQDLLLNIPYQVFRSMWEKYLVIPKLSFMTFDDAETSFRSIIPQLFALLQPAFAGGGGGGGFFGRTSISYFSADYRNTIIEAGRNTKLVRMVYDGYERLVEPYSLAYKIRKDGVGREYFYGVDQLGGRSGVVGIKMYTEDKVQSIELTDQDFNPRFPIELAKGAGAGASYFSQPFSSGRSVPRRPSKSTNYTSFYQPTYTIQCPYCSKTFKRSSYDTKLNRHKDRFGNQCYGTVGFLV